MTRSLAIVLFLTERPAGATQMIVALGERITYDESMSRHLGAVLHGPLVTARGPAQPRGHEG